jgi:hypothetical protein
MLTPQVSATIDNVTGSEGYFSKGHLVSSAIHLIAS